MNCEILHTLYVRSNGDVPCNDDAGESVHLGRLTAHPGSKGTVHTLFSNHRYRHIRDALQRGTVPWPGVCTRCAFFRAHETYADPLALRRLRKIQIEPSLECRLRCPGCSNQFQVHIRPQPFHMDLAVFEPLLRQLKADRFAVDEIEYCGQGEPLLHPQFPAFVRLARSYFPAAHQRLITSGNFDYQTRMQDERLDEIMVSCDGVEQETYARYRRGGRVERVFQFMRDAANSTDPRRPTVVWKYILFEWNDSPDEISRAQALAQELGVTTLLFVYTHSAGKSQRYTLENPTELPLRFANVVTNATPIHYRYSDQPQALLLAPPDAAGF